MNLKNFFERFITIIKVLTYITGFVNFCFWGLWFWGVIVYVTNPKNSNGTGSFLPWWREWVTTNPIIAVIFLFCTVVFLNFIQKQEKKGNF